MEHTRHASYEGRVALSIMAVVIPALGFGGMLFDVGPTFMAIWIFVLLVTSVLGASYAVVNIRSGGVFSCKLNEEEISQTIPCSTCGESFQIKLSEIAQIEIHDSGGDGSCDEWYIHTADGRYLITSNYGNPYRKFGEAVQKALPHIKTIKT